MTTLDDLKAALAAAQRKLAEDQASLEAARAAYAAAQADMDSLASAVVADQRAVDEAQAALDAYKPPAPTFLFGFWDDGPSVVHATDLRRTLGIPDTRPLFVRERTGVALGDPLVRETLPRGVNWVRATEINSRITDSHHYIDYHKCVTDPTLRAHIIRQTKEAADLPPGSYVEVQSEFNIDKHAPSGYTLAQRQKGYIEFATFVCEQLAANAPGVIRITSATQGLFNSNNYGTPESWLPPSLLGLLHGIGVDGYSKAWSAKPRTPGYLFDAALRWIGGKGKAAYITEFGVQEHHGNVPPNQTDGGAGKALEYAAYSTYFQAKMSVDGKTGLVHVMCNTAHDEPGTPDFAQWDPATSPKALAGFRDMVT